MVPVSIITDSTSDLSEELLKRYGISVLPLHIHLGDDEFIDGVDITPDEIYTWSDKVNKTPKTSTFSPGEASDFFRERLKEAEEIICFSISGSMSASGRVMALAAEDLEAEDKIHVIDSKNLSTGIGLLIIEAAEMAQKGFSVKEIIDRIEELKPRVRASFVVDTLTYLHRGGRCSGVAAIAGSALKIHPYISVVDGNMQPGKKYRGKMKKVFDEYVNDMEADLKKAEDSRVFVTYSGERDETIEAVINKVSGLGHFKEVLVTRAGSIISSHCGPGAMGVLFIAGE